MDKPSDEIEQHLWLSESVEGARQKLNELDRLSAEPDELLELIIERTRSAQTLASVKETELRRDLKIIQGALRDLGIILGALERLREQTKTRVPLLALHPVSDKMDAMSDREIMLKVIHADDKDFVADGKSDDYVAAMFDVTTKKARELNILVLGARLALKAIQEDDG